MQDTARRKAASLALMTIMLAGGMTIAMPGEQPQAAAQTGTLSVSATEAFGGPQILEIVVDDPSRDGLDPSTPLPDVRIDGSKVVMAQSNTGKWYAYVASDELTLEVSDILGPFTYFAADEAAFIGYGGSGAESFFVGAGQFLSAKELGGRNGGQIGVSDFDWPVIQVYGFKDDSLVDITHDAETVTLRYEADLSDLASIRVDRADVPAGGQVHVAISDVQLNLNPTKDDVWYMWANGTTTYGDDNPEAIDWQDIFRGDTGRLAIDNLDPITIGYVAGEGAMVEFEETGPSTGVFVSYDTDGESRITVNGDARVGSTFTVDYAGSDAQVIVDDFDFTLELARDGIGSTWDSGEDLTVRLTNENLNTNTLTEQNMEIGDDALPVLVQGDPITLGNVQIESAGFAVFGEELTINTDTHVATLRATNTTTAFTVTLSDSQLERLKSDTMSSYVHYSSEEFRASTDAQLNTTGLGLTASEPIPVVDGAPLRVLEEADGTFTITFTTDTITDADADQNVQIGLAVDAAVEAADAADANAQAVKSAAKGITGTTSEFDTALTNIDVAEHTAESILEAIQEAADANLIDAEGTIVADIFTFGADANDAIYRALLEETGPGSAVFEGTIEYKMLNQINADDPGTHADIAAVGDELVIILDGDYTGTDAPEVKYDEDNVSEDAPTHTGEVSFDAGAYMVADEVTVTLVDPDLNVESDGIDIYRVDAASEDAADTLLHLEMADGCTPGDLAAFSLRESADGSFVGTFDVPRVCGGATTTGKSLSVTYYDFRDGYGGMTEWRDSATVRADTGSVSLDRTVYPVPADDASVVVHVSVRDADFDESSSSVESIRLASDEPPVVVRIGERTVAALGTVDNPLSETSGDSGVFEASVEIGGGDAAIGQGSVITVSYTDPTGASGSENTVTDSAVFDLRSATLQSDRSSYVIGQDALLTLMEPDLNLDSADRESIPLELIGWDSEAGETDLGDAVFGAVPQSLRETGPDTGVFQGVITIPKAINGNALERGEPITLTYVDEGPSGADTVGDDERDVELFIATSDLGAAIELDRDAYTWTDKVFITIVAPDYNFDSNVIDEIGDKDDGEVAVRTRAAEIDGYRLAETGPDTGVFAGEVTLTGFTYGKIHTSIETGGSGPTDGTLRTNNEDGLSVSFEYSDSEAPLVASALIRWNVGEVQWLEAGYAATGSGVVRVVDPDMNTNPDVVDDIGIVVYSDTSLGGIDLTATETQESSGVFEGVVEFDPYAASQGHRLQVSEGDIVTAAYDDETLPKPDGRGDSLAVTATALIGSVVPPLERVSASNLAMVDASGSMMPSVSAGQQIQITADLTSGQDTDQYTTYLVLVEDGDGVPVHISWISGSLGAGKTFSPSQSWTPDAAGSYVVTVFVWESVTNPTALSPQLSITIDVA